MSKQDEQTMHTGKVANASNQAGKGRPTQRNEPQRTALSRSDREDHIGNNQSHMRKGGPNQGERTVRGRKG